ncbi:hypothetical protein GR925_00905 [Streptomyces sp. HUCO-GS316]|uniref:hypothetical protein n=1 Tax=Streptomyces sp. HUCO-GS316 TaxID=2692198 RepID=UPI001371798E|nr:hypothetical protein [Streptomyces sp. HUCO-GS316]MXM62045.1 hypothetical protein [Streptomyces sp. HUCO-GS316]
MDGDSGIPSSAARGVRIPPVLLKTLVTFVVATIAYVITNLINQSQDELWKLAVSIVIGGAALIVQYMVDFERRLASVEEGQGAQSGEVREGLAAHHREMKDMVEEKFQLVGDVTKLFSELERSRMGADRVRKLVESATRVGDEGPEIVKAFARGEIHRLTAFVEDLATMVVGWQGEGNEQLVRLTGHATRTIDATSSFVDLAYWETDAAQDYLEAQRDAIELREVRVRRLFIVTRADDVNDKLLQICRDQEEVGIETRVAVLSLLPPGVGRGGRRDFIIFDRELYFEINPDVERGETRSELNARASRVSEQIVRFNQLWEASQSAPTSNRVSTGP